VVATNSPKRAGVHSRRTTKRAEQTKDFSFDGAVRDRFPSLPRTALKDVLGSQLVYGST